MPKSVKAPLLSFNADVRAELADLCAGFERLPPPVDAPKLKHAAVAMTLVDHDGDLAFLITRRASRLRAHGGQWALPGGRCDAGETAVEAALRELHEELGMNVGPEHALGVLDDYPTRSGYLITPVVVWAGEETPIVPNPHEVESVHRIPFREIAHDEAVSFVRIPESPRPVLWLWMMDDHIHAPTAAVVYQVRELLLGRVTRVDGLEQPVFAWR